MIQQAIWERSPHTLKRPKELLSSEGQWGGLETVRKISLMELGCVLDSHSSENSSGLTTKGIDNEIVHL